MPSCFLLFGFRFFFWSNEFSGGQLEPVHIHVCKGKPSKDAPKWWVGERRICRADDGLGLERYGIRQSDIDLIEQIILANTDRIIEMWAGFFVGNDITFHDSVGGGGL